MKRLNQLLGLLLIVVLLLGGKKECLAYGETIEAKQGTIIYSIEDKTKKPYICIANKAQLLWVGDTFRFTIVANRLPEADIVWSVNHPELAQIDATTGEITLKDAGTITVYAKDRQSGAGSYCKIEVRKETSSFPELPREWYDVESGVIYDYGQGEEETIRIIPKEEYKEEMQQCRAVAFPDEIDGQKVSFIKDYNEYFRQLEYIKFPKYMITQYLSWTFMEIKNGKQVILPEYLKILYEVGGKELETLNLPKHITEIEYEAFDTCESLKELVIPSSVRMIDTSIEDLGGYLKGFLRTNKSCKNIHVDGNNKYFYSIYGVLYRNNKVLRYAPDSEKTSYTTIQWKEEPFGEIENYAFCNAKNLKWVKLSDDIKRIGAAAFKGCSSLKGITLPSHLESIEDKAFGGCLQLKNVVIPEGVKTIGHYCFVRCPNLTTVYIPKSVEKIGKDIFGEWYKDQVTILTPKGSYAEKYAKRNKISYRNESQPE